MTYQCIAGAAEAERASDRIVLSLVHLRERIDVSASAVLSIEAQDEQTFFLDTGASLTISSPSILLCFTPDIHHRISELSAGIVGEALEVFVAGQSIAAPVVREPLSSLTGFLLHAGNDADARMLFDTLCAAWGKPELRVVPRQA